MKPEIYLDNLPDFLKAYHPVLVTHLRDSFTSRMRRDVREWVQENVVCDTYRCNGHLFFEDAQEAMYFKLTWGGE
jgi:hypothetical protein